MHSRPPRGPEPRFRSRGGAVALVDERQPPAGARLTPPEIVAYLRSLPALWADSGPDARQTLTTAIFARTDVLGFERMEYELTPDAIALGLMPRCRRSSTCGTRSVSLVGARGLEPIEVTSSLVGRATGLRAS